MKYSNDTLFFIAAPFGNYIKFKKKANVIPVTGTWTLLQLLCATKEKKKDG